MKRIIHPNATQCQFDFNSLSLQPIPDNADIGITITPLPETQEQWWSELEYKHIPQKPGIYAIVNMLNGHFYIGSTANLQDRKCQHFSGLQRGKHENGHLQNAYNCYGSDAFRYVIIERVKLTENLIEHEQYYIDLLNPEYNMARVAGSILGIKRSEETKEKHKGNTHAKGHKKSEETRARISTTMTGRKRGPVSEKTRLRMSAAKKGKKRGPYKKRNKEQ